MKLFLISQSENDDYDTYDSAVVAAEDKTKAKNMNPMNGEKMVWGIGDNWCTKPKYVKVKYLGEADEKIKKGIICNSFNAG